PASVSRGGRGVADRVESGEWIGGEPAGDCEECARVPALHGDREPDDGGGAGRRGPANGSRGGAATQPRGNGPNQGRTRFIDGANRAVEGGACLHECGFRRGARTTWLRRSRS